MRRAEVISRLALVAVLSCASVGVYAQSNASDAAEGPDPVEAIGKAVRGLFDTLFGGGQKDEAPAAPPATESPPAAAPTHPAPIATPVEASAAPAPEVARPAPGTAAGRPAVPAPTPTPYARTTGGLHEAIAAGDRERAIRLVETGADIHAKDAGSGAQQGGGGGENLTPEELAEMLFQALMRGDQQMVELLITKGADVNSKTRTGMSTLHTAVFYQRLEVAEYLIERGADVNAKSASGVTPAGLAWTARNGPMRTMLQARGAQ